MIRKLLRISESGVPATSDQGRGAGFFNLWKEYASENPEASDVELVAAALPAALISPSFLYLVEPQASDGVVRIRI